MSARHKPFSAVVVAILVASVALIALGHLLTTSTNAREDPQAHDSSAVALKLAPGFTLTDLKGYTVSLKSLRGKVVFLNVWATWCGPCQQELPSIEKLYDEFKGYKDFVIVAVSEDSDGRKAATPFLVKHRYHFPVLLDPANEVGDEYGVAGIPETFIIDRQGRVVAHHLGPFDWARRDFTEALRELLNDKEKMSRSEASGEAKQRPWLGKSELAR